MQQLNDKGYEGVQRWYQKVYELSTPKVFSMPYFVGKFFGNGFHFCYYQ